jgi:Carbohydrate binding domain (family 11)
MVFEKYKISYMEKIKSNHLLLPAMLLTVVCFIAAKPLLIEHDNDNQKPFKVVIENFDQYSSDKQLAKAWYHPGHGGATIQTRDSITKAGGKYSLRFAYNTIKSEDKFYSPICRVDKWDLTGTNAVQFWFKPDGSGREMTFQFNIANSKGNNIHDLWEYKFLLAEGDTAARYLVLPYSDLKHNTKYKDSEDVSPVFLPGSVIEVAMYISGRNDEPGSGVYYFDEIVGIKK